MEKYGMLDHMSTVETNLLHYVIMLAVFTIVISHIRRKL